jgi:geranylgeranyl pyrophosphate synthase
MGMDKNIYFRMMRETSDKSDDLILKEIKLKYSGELLDLLLELPEKRSKSNKPKSRPAIFRFSYELTGGKEWTQYLDAAAAVEMLNLSTYMLNYFFDDKGGQKSKQHRNNECMAAMILRELAQKILRKIYNKIDASQIIQIDKCFSEINEYTSGIGQYIDGNMLREIEENYLDTYVQRCYGLTGVFMQNIAVIGGILAGASIDKIEKMAEFGKNYGIVVQMMNDLGDFLPQKFGMQSVGRVHQDQYSDLKHGCLTFPAYYVLIKGTEEEKQTVLRVKGNMNAIEEDCINVTHAFLRLDGIQEMKKLAGLYAKKSKESLAVFEASQAKSFLTVALTIYRYNKFYDSLKKMDNRTI